MLKTKYLQSMDLKITQKNSPAFQVISFALKRWKIKSVSACLWSNQRPSDIFTDHKNGCSIYVFWNKKNFPAPRYCSLPIFSTPLFYPTGNTFTNKNVKIFKCSLKQKDIWVESTNFYIGCGYEKLKPFDIWAIQFWLRSNFSLCSIYRHIGRSERRILL